MRVNTLEIFPLFFPFIENVKNFGGAFLIKNHCTQKEFGKTIDIIQYLHR
jgi:hypothetical protein